MSKKRSRAMLRHTEPVCRRDGRLAVKSLSLIAASIKTSSAEQHRDGLFVRSWLTPLCRHLSLARAMIAGATPGTAGIKYDRASAVHTLTQTKLITLREGVDQKDCVLKSDVSAADQAAVHLIGSAKDLTTPKTWQLTTRVGDGLRR